MQILTLFCKLLGLDPGGKGEGDSYHLCIASHNDRLGIHAEGYIVLFNFIVILFSTGVA